MHYTYQKLSLISTTTVPKLSLTDLTIRILVPLHFSLKLIRRSLSISLLNLSENNFFETENSQITSIQNKFFGIKKPRWSCNWGIGNAWGELA